MLTMCRKAYRRILYAENLNVGEEHPPSNHARLYVDDNEQTAHGESLGFTSDLVDSLRNLLRVENSWVGSYQHVVDEIVRSDLDIHDAHICFGSVNRTTHGPILGYLPTTPFTDDIRNCSSDF